MSILSSCFIGDLAEFRILDRKKYIFSRFLVAFLHSFLALRVSDEKSKIILIPFFPCVFFFFFFFLLVVVVCLFSVF